MNSYNLTSKGEHVRIGNWQEELALKENTGIRFYPNPKDRALSTITQERCITHTDQLKPKDYQSTLRNTIGDPTLHPEYKKERSVLGPRQRRLEEEMRLSVEREFEEKATALFAETRKVDYESTTQAGYLHPPFRRSVDPKGAVDRIATKNANYSTDQAITYYSHVVDTPGLKANFPTTFVGSSNPFKKHCPFTTRADLAVYSRRAETHERPKTLPTLRDHRTLSELRERLIEATMRIEYESTAHLDGRAIRSIISLIWSKGSGVESVSLDELQDMISSVHPGFALTMEERRAISVTFDLWNEDLVSLLEFTHHMRRTPAPRRLELIDMCFVHVDASGSGTISYETIKEKMDSGSAEIEHLRALLKAFSYSTGDEFGITVDDFFDYYIDISNEIGDDNKKFEKLLIDTWGKF